MQAELVFNDAITDETITELLNALREVAIPERGAEATLYLTSPGGELTAAFGAYDRIRHIQRRYGLKLTIVATGYCLSAGLILLQAGRQRKALPHTVFMVHQPAQFPWGEGKDQIQPQELRSRNFLHNITMDLVVDIFVRHSSQSPAFWRKMLSETFDSYFDAARASELGLIDEVVDDRDDDRE